MCILHQNVNQILLKLERKELGGVLKMRKILFAVGMAAVVILAAVSWFILPETVAVQIGLDGKVSNTMPKLLTITVPTVISVVGGIMSLKTNDSRKNKGIALLCIGIIIMLVTIFVNFNR